MTSFLHPRPLVGRIALVAVLLGALMPVIGQVFLRAADTQRWMEICTSAGMVRVAEADAANEGDAPPTPSAERSDCPFCVPYAGQVALPPETRQAALVRVRAEGAPRFAEIGLPHLRRIWRAAPSRAPPRAA